MVIISLVHKTHRSTFGKFRSTIRSIRLTDFGHLDRLMDIFNLMIGIMDKLTNNHKIDLIYNSKFFQTKKKIDRWILLIYLWAL